MADTGYRKTGGKVLSSDACLLSSVFPPLLIEAERVAQTVHTGIHGRRRAGVGETFWQFRRYEQGDPADRIDWRQSARTDKIFVREREWEAAQTAYLWADSSGSMHFASKKDLPTKLERARLLMLALASLLLRGGEKVTWLDRRNLSVHGRNGLERIAAQLGDIPGESLPPDIPLARHASAVLCSDFLMPPEKIDAVMRRYAALHLRGILVHILDPLENNFAIEGRVEMQGGEGEAPLLVPNAGAVRDTYKHKLDEHKARLMRLAASAGWNYLPHVTDEAPHLVLLKLYDLLTAERGA